MLCTGVPGDSTNCTGECPWRSPASVHHHRPNLGRCDAVFTCHHHRTINARFGVPFALPHCAAPSHHRHVDAVNRAALSPRPTSPSSRRAASLSSVPPHCCPVHSLRVPGGRSDVGVTLPRPACEPAWCRSHFSPGLPCMATGSASETSTTLGEGGRARRVELRNQMIWSGCTLQPLAVGPNINYNEMMIKRQAYNE